MQTSLFDNIIPNGIIRIHEKENNHESQSILDENKKHFSNQCEKVYQLLKEGKILTTTIALQYGIGDLRARIRDLIKSGIPVQKKLLKNRFKEYYL